MTHTVVPMKRAAMAAAVLASLVLAGCSGTGSLALTGTGSPTSATTDDAARVVSPALAATGDIATGAGDIVSSAGNLVTTLGTSVAGLTTPGMDNGVATGVGGLLQNTGNAVQAVGESTAAGLGQIASLNADPLGTTLSGLPAAVQYLGVGVSSTGNAVSSLDNNSALGVLQPVTDPVGNLVDNTGQAVSSLGVSLGNNMDTTVVQRVSTGLSTLIVPIAENTMAATQALGAGTGLGQPVDNLLVRVGTGVQGLGDNIAATPAPVISDTGQLVSSVGNTVAMLGGALNADGTSAGSGLGNLGTVLAPVTSVVSGLTGGTLPDAGGLGGVGGASGLLAPVTNVVSGVVSGLGGATGGTGGTGVTGGILPPVISAVGGVLGTVGGSSGVGGASGTTAPVTGLLAGVGGLLR